MGVKISSMLIHYRRELSVAVAILALALVLAIVAPGYFAGDNLRDLFLANVPGAGRGARRHARVLVGPDRHLRRIGLRRSAA